MNFCKYVVTLYKILAIWVKIQGVRLFFLPFDDRMHSDRKRLTTLRLTFQSKSPEVVILINFKLYHDHVGV